MCTRSRDVLLGLPTCSAKTPIQPQVGCVAPNEIIIFFVIIYTNTTSACSKKPDDLPLNGRGIRTVLHIFPTIDPFLRLLLLNGFQTGFDPAKMYRISDLTCTSSLRHYTTWKFVQKELRRRQCKKTETMTHNA